MPPAAPEAQQRYVEEEQRRSQWMQRRSNADESLTQDTRSMDMKGILFASALISIAGCTAPEPEASTPTQAPPGLAGVWELASYTVTNSNGVSRFPFGHQPKGQIVYTENGQMSAQLMRSDYDLTPFTELDFSTALQELGLSAFFSYWGTYDLDEAAGTVTHRIEGCLYPAWVGASQVRNFRLEDPNHLVLWAQLADVGDPGDLYELGWTRIQ